jgi:hypothetical protein
MTLNTITLNGLALLCLTVLPNCSATARTQALSSASKDIRWPERYEPTKSRFFVRNEIEIHATPAIVWSELVDYTQWSSYYRGAAEVRLITPPRSRTLAKASVFEWRTMGLRFKSTVHEWEPGRRLSWESVNRKITGYHAWLIIPTAQGCKLVTEESQLGWLTYLERVFQPNKLRLLHDEWLAGIKKRAEQRTH